MPPKFLKDLTKNQKLSLLKHLMVDLDVIISCDEEWNTLFNKFDINIDSETKRPVIFGLSGSEIKETYD